MSDSGCWLVLVPSVHSNHVLMETQKLGSFPAPRGRHLSALALMNLVLSTRADPSLLRSPRGDLCGVRSCGPSREVKRSLSCVLGNKVTARCSAGYKRIESYFAVTVNFSTAF